MVFVAILVGAGVLMGFVALAVDGGNALLQRRNMQNAADAASLGAAKILADNIFWGPESPDPSSPKTAIYLVTDDQLKTAVSQFTAANGITNGLGYSIELDTGTYRPQQPGCNPYCWEELATNSSGLWDPPIGSVNPISSTVDAIRVRTLIEAPTTFARAIGINSIQAGAVSAAALIGDPNHIVQGPTWPMTSYLDGVNAADYLQNYGLCKPAVFYDEGSPSDGVRFQHLISLSQAQGCSFTQGQLRDGGGTAPDDCSSVSQLDAQLIANGDYRDQDTGLDDEAYLRDYTEFDRNYFQECDGKGGWQNKWSPLGSCSESDDPLNTIRIDFGTICCRTNLDPNKDHDISDIDIANWIVWDFHGQISPAESAFPGGTPVPGETTWLNLDSPRTREDFRPNDNIPGDWLETYLSTSRARPDQVILPILDYISEHGTSDVLSGLYGNHVDKVMYLYKEGEVWRGLPTPTAQPTPTGTPAPPAPGPSPVYAWVTPDAGSVNAPDRVHMVQPLKFRFYSAMASTSGGWIIALPAACGGGSSQVNEGAAVMAVIVGEILDQPPASPAAHSLYNYVGFVDANQ
jgi:hypothetical protein